MLILPFGNQKQLMGKLFKFASRFIRKYSLVRICANLYRINQSNHFAHYPHPSLAYEQHNANFVSRTAISTTTYIALHIVSCALRPNMQISETYTSSEPPLQLFVHINTYSSAYRHIWSCFLHKRWTNCQHEVMHIMLPPLNLYVSPTTA